MSTLLYTFLGVISGKRSGRSDLPDSPGNSPGPPEIVKTARKRSSARSRKKGGLRLPDVIEHLCDTLSLTPFLEQFPHLFFNHLGHGPAILMDEHKGHAVHDLERFAQLDLHLTLPPDD